VKTLFVLLSAAGLAAAADALRIRVDPRLELVAAIQSVSGGPYLAPKDSPYKRRMEIWFSPWSDHPAVTTLKAVWGNNVSGPASAMVCVSDPPELAFLIPVRDCPSQPPGGPAQLQAWMDAVRDFARESGFSDFFAGQRLQYRGAEAWVRSHDLADNIALIEEYFNQPQHSYTIVISPLTRASYGPYVPTFNGSNDLYAIIRGPASAPSKWLPHLIRHEFGHSFTNPAIRRSRAHVQRYAHLFPPLSAKMARLGYTTWEVCVYEHVLRAVVARMALRNEGPREAAQLLAAERARGFAYIDPLYSRLAEYESHPAQYPTFEHFVPRLLEAFSENVR
jgi:hypothetical protein